MLESFLGALNPMMIMFSCILAGYVLNKMKLMPESTAAVLSKCERYLFLPALGYGTMAKYCTVSSISEYSNLILYSVLAIVIGFILAIPISKAFEPRNLDKRNVYKYALVFANYGTLGNGIVPLVLGGEEHLYSYLIFTLSLSIWTYVWGFYVLTPKENRSGNIFKNLFNPPMVAMILGMIVGLTGAQQYVPEFLVKTMDSLQSCMVPVAMILAGFVIGDYSFKSLLSNKKVYILTALRLIVLPVFILAILILCKADRYTVTMALFAYAAPVGLNTIVFPAMYNQDTKLGASMAMISHVLCVVTVPIMYGILQHLYLCGIL